MIQKWLEYHLVLLRVNRLANSRVQRGDSSHPHEENWYSVKWQTIRLIKGCLKPILPPPIDKVRILSRSKWGKKYQLQ